MQRIMVIGSPGAGKSTLSVAMAGKLSLPLYHLDKLYWKAGWIETPREMFVSGLLDILRKFVDAPGSREVIILRSTSDVTAFLNDLRATMDANGVQMLARRTFEKSKSINHK